jgi:hypothetical protein
MAIRRNTNQARKDLQKRFETSGQYWLEKFPARLGNYSRVVAVPNKPGMVYARLETSGQVVEAVNWLAPGIFDFPVFVGRDKSQPSVLKVSEIRWVYSLGAIINFIAFHHEQHEYPNADTVWVRRDQFMPLLVLPAGGFAARMFGDVIYAFGMDHPIRVPDTDLDLSAYALETGARYVLLEVLPDGTLNYIVGDTVASRELLESLPLPTPSNNSFPICAFEFFAGQTALRRDSTERTIIDLRMFTSDTSADAATQWHTAPEKTSLDDLDELGIWDSISEAIRKITWSNIKTALQSYFDGVYSLIGHTHPSDTHAHGLMRWNGIAGDDTFDLVDIAEFVESLKLNGLDEDPAVYTLSADGTQIILDDALTSDTLVTANIVMRSIS